MHNHFHYSHALRSSFLALTMVTAAGTLQAGIAPLGDHDGITLEAPNENGVIIARQYEPRAILSLTELDIGPGEVLRIVFGNEDRMVCDGDQITLIEVSEGDVSETASVTGGIESPCRIALRGKKYVELNEGSYINAASVWATTNVIDRTEFLESDIVPAGTHARAGWIKNRGLITTQGINGDNAYVVFTAPQVLHYKGAKIDLQARGDVNFVATNNEAVDIHSGNVEEQGSLGRMHDGHFSEEPAIAFYGRVHIYRGGSLSIYTNMEKRFAEGLEDFSGVPAIDVTGVAWVYNTHGAIDSSIPMDGCISVETSEWAKVKFQAFASLFAVGNNSCGIRVDGKEISLGDENVHRRMRLSARGRYNGGDIHIGSESTKQIVWRPNVITDTVGRNGEDGNVYKVADKIVEE